MHRWGRMLLEMRDPRTNQKWLESFQALGKQVETCGIKPKHYQFWWLARAHIIVEMRHHGIARLRISVDWTNSQATKALATNKAQWLPLWMTSAVVLVVVVVGGLNPEDTARKKKRP